MKKTNNTMSKRIGSAIDNVLSVVSPRMALKRKAARLGIDYLGRAFKGADLGRLRNSWLPGNSSADQALLQDLPTLRERSRDLNRNDAHASGITQTIQTNTISTGIRPQSLIPYKVIGISEERARGIQDIAEYEFDVWNKEADAGGRMTFYDMQDLVCRQVLESGESLILPVSVSNAYRSYSYALQVVEADRLETPSAMKNDKEVRSGVRIGQYGEAKSYFVRNTHPGDYQFGTKDNSYKEIKASDKYGRKNIYHLYHVDRPGQTRGIPFFAPVLTYFKDLGSYAESELVAARISACYAMIVETEASMDEDPVGGSAPVLKDGQYLEGNIEPGMIKRLYPGEKFNSFNPTRPSSTFEPFVLWILRSISTSLGLPYELVTKDFSRTNYSSARAALLQAYKFFKKRQHWFAAHMCQPTWASVLEEAYLKNKFGDIPFYEFYYYFTNALWMPDGWEWVDPLKEARAEEVELKNGTTTLSEIYSKKGQDWEEALEQRAKEKKKMKELGISDEDIKKVITDKEEKEDEEEDDVEDDDEK